MAKRSRPDTEDEREREPPIDAEEGTGDSSSQSTAETNVEDQFATPPASSEQPAAESGSAEKSLVVLHYDGDLEECVIHVIRKGGKIEAVRARKGELTAPLDDEVAEKLLASKKGFSVPAATTVDE